MKEVEQSLSLVSLCLHVDKYLYLFIEEQFYEQFNAEEKRKLYDAIGYQENEADPTLPKEVIIVVKVKGQIDYDKIFQLVVKSSDITHSRLEFWLIMTRFSCMTRDITLQAIFWNLLFSPKFNVGGRQALPWLTVCLLVITLN